MNSEDFFSDLGDEVEKHFIELGFFRRNSKTFCRHKKTHEINIVQFQLNSSEPKVAVGLGVHYDFLPLTGTNQEASIDVIEVADCEIKLRLVPNDSQSDFWWPMTEESKIEISLLIREKCHLLIDQYDISGEISRISPDTFTGKNTKLLSVMTRVRASYLLAKLHEHQGHDRRALEFANYGIINAGVAVGLKKKLKDIVARIETKSIVQ